MIRKEMNVIEAKCDVCEANLVFREGGYQNVNSAILKLSFGYGSVIDDMPGPSYDLCEICWRTALKALGVWQRYINEYHGGEEPKLPSEV